MTGYWASYSNLLFNHGLPTVFSLWKTIWSPCWIYFSNLLQLFCESPCRSPWYLNSDWNTNVWSQKRRASGLPIQIYCLILGFQRASLCGRPFEARVVYIFQNYRDSFVKARLEARVIKALKNKWFGLKMTGFWASYSNLLFNHGLPTVFSLWKTIWSPCCVWFSNLLELFCESPSRSPWYFNSDWNTNVLSQKRRASGLPIQIYCLILGFERASLCGRPFEARVVSIFQIYCNSFVKARPEARDLKALKKQIASPQNDGLLGFLFKPTV